MVSRRLILGHSRNGWKRASASGFGTLPPDTNRLLLAAAAEPTGDVDLLWRAAAQMDIDPEAATPARSAGLLDVGAQVRFPHPLMRSAVYGAGSVSDRQTAHRALADSIDPEVDPDRRVWHLAQAAPGYDEDVALELERSADRAQARGGIAAAAAFLERSAELTARSRPSLRSAVWTLHGRCCVPGRWSRRPGSLPPRKPGTSTS